MTTAKQYTVPVPDALTLPPIEIVTHCWDGVQWQPITYVLGPLAYVPPAALQALLSSFNVNAGNATARLNFLDCLASMFDEESASTLRRLMSDPNERIDLQTLAYIAKDLIEVHSDFPTSG